MTRNKQVKDRTRNSWNHMRHRVFSPNNERFNRYGGRGITICERWLDYTNFLIDMGNRPEGTTLERIDNDKGYGPDNCRWATQIDQQNNTSRNHIIEYKGEKKTLTEWARVYGLTMDALRTRLRRKWTLERALTEPIQQCNRRKGSTYKYKWDGQVCSCGQKIYAKGKCERCYMRAWEQANMLKLDNATMRKEDMNDSLSSTPDNPSERQYLQGKAGMAGQVR